MKAFLPQKCRHFRAKAPAFSPRRNIGGFLAGWMTFLHGSIKWTIHQPASPDHSDFVLILSFLLPQPFSVPAICHTRFDGSMPLHYGGPMPSRLRLRRSGLSILEALTLLAICAILLVIVVPVTLVRMGILKPTEQVGSTPPKSKLREKTRSLTPVPTLITPKAPAISDAPPTIYTPNSPPRMESPKVTPPSLQPPPRPAPAPLISPTISPTPFTPIPLTEEAKR